jgi:hypothetical protein
MGQDMALAITAKRLATLRANGRKPGAPKGSGGRPPVYRPEQAQAVLDLMAKGWPLTKVCELPGMPHRDYVLAWNDGRRKAPLAQFDISTRKRQYQHASLADEILTLSDESRGLDMAGVQSHRLSVDSRKWLLSKIRHELYGDKLAISSNANAVININLPAKGSGNGPVIDGQGHEVAQQLLDDGSEGET